MSRTLSISLLLVTLLSPFAMASDAEYRELLAGAVRATANRFLPSIVVVEVVGGSGKKLGEVEQDAPTSGMVVDAEGHILASDIVVRQTSASLLVVLADGSRHAATVVARDHHRGLVLLKIKTDKTLDPIELPDKVTVRTGQTIVAIGRYGVDASPLVSRGIFSGMDRLDGIAYQADARVTASFYGGLLVDLYGNPLGIVIPAVAEGGAEAETDWYDSGITFAIPVDVIKKNLDRMKQGNDIKKGLIGIVSKSKDPYENQTELAAIRVRSPAEKAGLKAGDIVKTVDGVAVKRHQDIRLLLGRFDAGDSIEMVVDRAGKEITFKVSLSESLPPLEPQRLGVIVTESKNKDFNVEVVHVLDETPSASSLQPGDGIAKIGQLKVETTEGLRRQLIAAEPKKAIELTVIREKEAKQITITPESIESGLIASIPDEWKETKGEWEIKALKLPDAANEAAVLGPKSDDELKRLGLLVVLSNPGDPEPSELLKKWQTKAKDLGVVVCAISYESNERWQPKEIEVITRFIASVLKRTSVDPMAVAVAASGALSGEKAEAADSMALAVAMSASRTIYGVAVSDSTRPPAVRLRENDAEASLQVLLPVEKESELPVWAPTLQKTGYPVIRGGKVDQESLLRWVRLLQAV